MYKKILAGVSLGLFFLFFYFMGRQVEEAGWLIAVLVITAAMAGYDFWCDAFKKDQGKKSETDDV